MSKKESHFSFELLKSCLSIPSVIFPSLVLKMQSSSRFVNALESLREVRTQMMSRHQPELLVLCPAVRENVGEFQRHQLGTQPPDGRHVEEFEVFQAEVGQLGSDDVEERQDGLHQADGVLRADAVAQLQLGEVGAQRDGGQHHQVQVTVVEASQVCYHDSSCIKRGKETKL